MERRIEYKPVTTSYASAKAIEQLAQDDLVMRGRARPMQTNHAKEFAVLSKRYADLRLQSSDYLGAYDRDDLQGFVHTEPWSVYQQIPYETGEAYEALRRKARIEETEIYPSSLGIVELRTNVFLDAVTHGEIVERFLDHATDRALALGHRALFLEVGRHDALEPFLDEHNFVFTGKYHQTPMGKAEPRKLYTKTLDL